MIFKNPDVADIPTLKKLWLEAFGDSDEFFMEFIKKGYHQKRCRIAEDNGKVVSVLYFFDCLCEDKKIAYIYGVTTDKKERGKGYSKALFSDTHKYLEENGYSGAILVPSEDPLFTFYENLGYKTATFVDLITLTKSQQPPISLKKINKSEYAALRRKFLTAGSVIQENENLDFLECFENFYTANGVLLAAHIKDGTLYTQEFLGAKALLPSVLAYFNADKGIFRTVGTSRPFAMYHPFYKNSPKPTYFGLAFD